MPYDINKAKIYFDIDKIKSYVDCLNKYFRFYYEDKIYQIIFNKKNASKYIWFFTHLKQDRKIIK